MFLQTSNMQFANIEGWQYVFSMTLLLSVLILFFTNSSKRKRKKREGMPPGPKGLPVIGNLHQLRLPAHQAFAHLATKYGPVFSLRLGSMNAVVISSYNTAKHFFATNDLAFASRPPSTSGKHFLYNYSDMALAPYGPTWRDARKLCTLQLLTTKRVQSFAHVRRQELHTMAETLWRDSEEGKLIVNLTEAFNVLTTRVMWRIICGQKLEGYQEIAEGITFKKLLYEISIAVAEFNVGDLIPGLDWLDIQGIKRRLKRVRCLYDLFADKVISQRLKHRQTQNHTEDFLDILIAEEFPRDRIKALMFNMAAGGTETTSTVMEWAMSFILKHPHVMRNVQKEIEDIVGKGNQVEEPHLEKLKYLQCVLKETMRLHPPLPLTIPHYSMEDANLCGYHVPKGSMLFLNIWAINRDPAVWEDAEGFRPERFMKEETVDLHGHDLKSIPFGSGRRGCPAAGMAIPMMMLTLSTLIHCFDWSVPGEVDMTEEAATSAPRKYPLLAIPHLRNALFI